LLGSRPMRHPAGEGETRPSRVAGDPSVRAQQRLLLIFTDGLVAILGGPFVPAAEIQSPIPLRT
jgi:hypothetical protein